MEVYDVGRHEVHVVFLKPEAHNERTQVLEALAVPKHGVRLHNASEPRSFVGLDHADPVL
jgi:hypothetical protein